MEEAKMNRMNMERRAMIRKRGKVLSQVLLDAASSRPLHTILPPLADLAALDNFRSVIEDTPSEEDVTEDHFQQAMVAFPEIVTAWRQSKDEELVAMINAHPDMHANATVATLYL
ncbi:hypothetical protein H0H81_008401, partial [Sphagnurus paluster]